MEVQIVVQMTYCGGQRVDYGSWGDEVIRRGGELWGEAL